MSKKGSWVVKMRCVVDKVVYCDGCTEEEAHDNPWDYATEETETNMRDWEVYKVEPNE